MSMEWTSTAAKSAANAIPPAWGLEATVAVNPFLGQTGQGLAETAALLARVGGARIFPDRQVWRDKLASGEMTDEDLVDALLANGAPVDLADLKVWLAQDPKPAAAVPNVSNLAAKVSGIAWPDLVAERFGAFAAALFDRGQALWVQPGRETVWDTWRAWARRDLTPEIQGLKGFAARIAALPPDAPEAIAMLCARLGVTEAAAGTYFHALLTDLGGWAQLARQTAFEAAKHGQDDATLTDLLAIRLAFDEALHAQYAEAIAGDWADALAAHAAPVAPNGDQVIDAILQTAAERAAQRALAAALDGGKDKPRQRPAVQAAFCIDVRSEVFRRAFEATDPGVETLGFAGFFGLGAAHRAFASDVCEARLPVLLNPGLTSTAAGEADDLEARFAHRARRAWGRFKVAAVSSFAFVEASGPIFGAKLLKDSFHAAHGHDHGPAPRLDPMPSASERVAAAKKVLQAMSLTKGFARIVMIAGHGASAVNNPHESALHCGACGGYAGDVNARLLAGLLNDRIVRNGLKAEGIEIPADTLFVAALHVTTSDRVVLFDADQPVDSHAADIARLKALLDTAGRTARGERAVRLPRAKGEDLATRGNDWSETRPEWGLAGASAFIAAPRERTAGSDLQGRAFLHNYDWQADEGFQVLELILTAPVVVASWISLQYYGSTVAPELFGGGNKVLHNVVGGVGVVEGNGGRLRTGLPLQSVHDGARFVHDPLRLTVAVEAPKEAISAILARHKGVAELFDNGWLTLFAMDGGRLAWRYLPGGEWEQQGETPAPAAEKAIAAE